MTTFNSVMGWHLNEDSHFLQIVSEEKASVADSEVEPYRRNPFFHWLEMRNREEFKKLSGRKVPLHDIVVWVDPLDATQEFTGK